jgi:hypothetical protein
MPVVTDAMPLINEKFCCTLPSWVHNHPLEVTQGHASTPYVGVFEDLITGHVSPTSPDIVIATLNINTVSVTKLAYVLDRMSVHHIDVMLLQDTRHLKDSAPLYAKTVSQYWQAYGGPSEGAVGSQLLSYPVKHPKAPGGHMIVCKPKWGRRLFDWGKDPTELGLSMWADFSFDHRKLRVVSTYWPTRNDSPLHPNSLFNSIKAYAKLKAIPGSPYEIIQHILSKSLLPFVSPSRSYIVAGDFNTTWQTSLTASSLSNGCL